MAKTDQYFDGEELWFRCTHCGDSQRHPGKAHASVNVFTGTYYCYKCGASGKMSSRAMSMATRGLRLKFDTEEPFHKKDDFLDTIAETIKPGPALNRYSAADRYHFVTSMGEKIDVFHSVMPGGGIVGYHFRPQDKSRIRTFGQKMFAMSSKIRHNNVWRLVEGPYDILDPHMDFCCFGFPSDAQIEALPLRNLIICPDGDVFEDYRKLRSFMNPIFRSNNIFVEYVERLPPGKDPDEVMPSKRERLSLSDIKRMLTPKRTFFAKDPRYVTAEQVLAEIKSNQTEAEFWG